MTEERMALAELLQKAGESDFLRAVAEAVLQILMEADVEGLAGAARHERSPDRLNYRNRYRDRSLDARLGSLQLRVPKLRQGSYFPPLTLHGASFTSVQQLRAAIDALIAAYNPHATPFQWCKATIRPKSLASRITNL
jgi:transposase-like protein